MALPDIVQSTLDGPVVARVGLGDEDELIVTPTRSLRYHAESLLSDATVEEFPHAAERVTVSDGRRTAAITLDYGLEGERELSVPSDRVDDALHPVLAGVLSATDVIDPGETVRETFRFSELTVVVTDARIVEHVGAAVWDDDHEEFPFDDLAGFAVEEGNVATQFVLAIDGRRERIKIPNERARAFDERVRTAIREHRGIDSVDELGGEPTAEDGDAGPDGADGDGDPDDDGHDPALEARIDDLAEAVEQQQALLTEQREAIERLRERLTRAR